MPPRVSTNPAIPHMFELYAFTCGAAKGLLGIVGRGTQIGAGGPCSQVWALSQAGPILYLLLDADGRKPEYTLARRSQGHCRQPLASTFD